MTSSTNSSTWGAHIHIMALNLMDLVDELHQVGHMAALRDDSFLRVSWYDKVHLEVNLHTHEPTTRWTIYVS